MASTYNLIASKTKGFTTHAIFDKVTITPEDAAEMLKHNNFNRPLKQSLIRAYADDMYKGKWQYNGDSIRFDKNGNLIDGQNRLHGVVLSGKPIVTNVQTGIDVESFQTIDTGRKRTTSDIVYLHNIPNSTTIAGAISLILKLKEETLLFKKGKTSNMFVTEFIRDEKNNLSMLQECAKASSRYTKGMKFLSGAYYCALLYVMREKYGDKAIEFFELLESGINLEEKDPILVLRKKFTKDLSQYRRLESAERAAYTIKAFNAWITGKPLTYIVWNRNKESFPQIL